MLSVWCGICLGWRWLLCLPKARIVASVLVRLRECVDRVIVCDDGSVDLTGDIAEAMGAVVVRHDVSGKGLSLCVGCWWLLVLSVTVFTIAGF